VSMIEVLDRAIPAEHKSWPPRTLFCLLGLMAAAWQECVGIDSDSGRKVMDHPENRRKYHELLEGRSAH